MNLPEVDKSQLQKIVYNVEYRQKPSNFVDLCNFLAQTEWAKQQGLKAEVLSQLVLFHKVITKVPRPTPKPEPPKVVAPKPEPPKVVAPKPELAAPPKSLPVQKLEQPKEEPSQSKPLKEIKVFDEGGRGRKQCPACKKYVGALSGKCVCGHIFERRKKEKDLPSEPSQPQSQPQSAPKVRRVSTDGGLDRVARYVSTPAGKPPVKLQGTDRESVAVWADAVRTSGYGEGLVYQLSALIYWVRYFYEVNSDEYQTVRGHLKEIELESQAAVE